jgi:hypothetical protein
MDDERPSSDRDLSGELDLLRAIVASRARRGAHLAENNSFGGRLRARITRLIDPFWRQDVAFFEVVLEVLAVLDARTQRRPDRG